MAWLDKATIAVKNFDIRFFGWLFSLIKLLFFIAVPIVVILLLFIIILCVWMEIVDPPVSWH